jgi:hypothetical protein
MKKESVLELKTEILKSLWAQTAQYGGVQSQGLINPYVDKRLAIGYSGTKGEDYQLEIRVQRPHGEAYEQALKYKHKAKNEANIEVVPSIEIPSRGAALDQNGHEGLATKRQPLHIGLSVGHPEGGAGTLGAFVSDDNGDPAILSNNHVLALMGQAKLGDPIYQPGRPDRGSLMAKNAIATLSNYVLIMRNDRNKADAAVATLKNDVAHEANRIPQDYPSAGATIRLADSPEDLLGLLKKDEPVRKIGRTTGLTEGRISAVSIDNLTVKTAVGNVVFDNVIEIKWESNRKPFSKPGDSGSMVFTKEGLWGVGLHFAGAEKKPVGMSYCCSINTILEMLDLSWLD